MKKAVLGLLFLSIILSVNVVSATCTFQRLYWGSGTAVENTDVTINIMVKGDTCQEKVVSLSVKEYDHGLTDDSATSPASVTIGSNSPPDGAWVFVGGTWITRWQEDTDHPGETNPPEYYIIATLDGQNFSSRDILNSAMNLAYLNVTKYVAPPQPQCTNNSWCQSQYGANYICWNENCTLANSACVDSDGGVLNGTSPIAGNSSDPEIYIGGNITINGQIVFTDQCYNITFQGFELKEGHCENEMALYSERLIQCNFGCQNEACKINISDSTNQTSVTLKEQAFLAINQSQKKLQAFKNKTLSYPIFYRESIENAVDVVGLQQQINNIRNSYNSSNSSAEYQRVINLSASLNIPTSISTTKTADAISFFPQRGDVAPNIIANITEEAYDSNRVEDYKDAILTWYQKNIDSFIDFEEISVADNYGTNPLIKVFRVSIDEKTDTGKNIHFIIRKLENLKFERNYGETEQGDYVHINAVPGTIITFSTTEDIEFVDSPLFVSPDLTALSLASPPEPPEKDSRWWLFLIIILVILVIGATGYIFINKWYKNKYEIHLFKTKNNLFNILSYINNSKKNGMPDLEVKNRLRKSGWTGEQIDYAMRKYYGEKIFMTSSYGQKINKNSKFAPRR